MNVSNKSEVKNVVIRFRHIGAHLEGSTSRAVRRDLDEASFANLHGKPREIRVDKGLRLNAGDVAGSELWKLSMLSFAIHSKETDLTLIEINPNPDSSIQDHFKFIFFRTYEIWKQLWPTNLLFVGADVIARREFGFPDSKDFRMFGRANPLGDHISRRIGADSIYKKFNPYFNADVRYFPSTMSESAWKIGLEWATTWENYWEYEQDLYNAMAEVAPVDYDDRWAWQMPSSEPSSETNAWNSNPITEAFLVHLHSTRDTFLSIEAAKLLLQGWPGHVLRFGNYFNVER